MLVKAEQSVPSRVGHCITMYLAYERRLEALLSQLNGLSQRDLGKISASSRSSPCVEMAKHVSKQGLIFGLQASLVQAKLVKHLLLRLLSVRT